MAIISLKTRKKVLDVGLVAFICWFIWTFQLTILNRFFFNQTICNLPLTFVILWGSVFGGSKHLITPDDLRIKSWWQIFLMQLSSGSVSGALVGGLMAALYSSVISIYPFYLPAIGWIAGYFCLRNLNRQNLLCVPIVLILTGVAEALMSLQLYSGGRSAAFEELASFVFPEALLNAIIAPFVYFPMRRWYDFVTMYDTAAESS